MATADENGNWIQLVADNILIGKGGFGEVYGPCVWKDKSCAVKKRVYMYSDVEKCEKDKLACITWMSLKHRNLITVYDVNVESPALYILMEFALGGSLKCVLERITSDLPEQILMNWSIQIAEGMAYLHHMNCVHRDLKSPNIMIMEHDAATDLFRKTLKIIDFDQIHEQDHTTAMSIAGTAAWTAPEVVVSEQFSKASDVWSYGVVVWEMLTREIPYKGVSNLAILSNISTRTHKLSVPASCPDTIKRVVKSCLQHKKDKRPTFDYIVSRLRNRQNEKGKMMKESITITSMISLTDMETEPDLTNNALIGKGTESNKGIESMDEGIGSMGKSSNTSMNTLQDMETEPDPANKALMSEGIKTMDKASMISRQVMKHDSKLDDRRTDKPVRITIRDKMKHLFSKSGSIRSKTSPRAEAYSASKTVTGETIERHRDFLEEHIEADFGLLDKLLSNGTLSKREVSEVKDKSPFYKRNSELLNYILEKHQSDRLIEVLRDTEQMHILNFLNGNGEYNTDYGEEWPLTKRETSILDANQESLIELLDLSILIDLLFLAEVINIRQKVFISTEPNPHRKTEALLDILRRRSLSDFRRTIGCLRQSNQNNIADVFESGGVVVKVHAHLDGPLENFTQAEDEIVSRLERVLSGTSIEESGRLLERLHLKIIAAKKGHSVLLYIWCETKEELLSFYHLLISGHLKDTVEQLFNALLTPLQRTAVKNITMNYEEFETMQTYLAVKVSESEDQESVDVTEAAPNSVIYGGYEEPLYSQQFSMDVDVSHSPESELAEDKDRQKEELVKDKDRQKEEVAEIEGDMKKQAAAGTLFTEDEPMTEEDINAAILRDNTDFFTQHMRLKGVINKLHSAEILTDEETRYIKTLDDTSEKIDEILNIVRNATPVEYNKFVSYLRESGQTLVADVAEKGGLVLQIKVTLEPTEHVEEQIVEKLNQLQDKTVPKSEEMWHFLSQLKRADIEIVSSQLVGGVVVWCWGRSQAAVKIFDHLSKSDMKQPNLLTGLFGLLLCGRNAPTMRSVCLENQDSEVVCRGRKKFHSKLNFTINERQALGVAIIREKICLLCQNPNAIVVYGEEESVNPVEELPLNDVIIPMDMAYSKESNCVYITDKGRASVWKIAFPSSDNKVDLWLDSVAADPFTISVTNDGCVVMVKRGSPSTLNIYHPITRLHLPLDLPPFILKPNHAVLTYSGTFVVCHGWDIGVRGGICVISKEGQLISRFDSKFEFIAGVEQNVNINLAQLAKAEKIEFTYLAIDDEDQVYVCDDSDVGELRVFDSRLFQLETGKPGLNVVHRVQYLKERRQLVVLHGLQKNCISILDME